MELKVGKAQGKVSTELRGKFIEMNYPIPFGILDNLDVNYLPYSHKRLLADAFYRAWTYRQNKQNEKAFFLLHERGPWYKKHHYDSFLEKVFSKFENLGLIQKLGRSKGVYIFEMEKILNGRHL